jgi:ribosomal protein S18 acetylase RimI-like enzyme
LAAQAEPDIEIRAIRPGDTLTGLSLGDVAFAPLKTFVQRHAQAYERQSLARTYGAFDRNNNDKLIGYVTLVCGEVVIQEGDEALVAEDGMQYLYRQYPAIKIARLAVDRRFRSLGIGEALVNLALGIAQQLICPNVGCRFVMVDSKQQSVGFYDRRGFTMLDTQENRDREEPVMFVDLSKLD